VTTSCTLSTRAVILLGLVLAPTIGGGMLGSRLDAHVNEPRSCGYRATPTASALSGNCP
jgi:hypothetical protein